MYVSSNGQFLGLTVVQVTCTYLFWSDGGDVIGGRPGVDLGVKVCGDGAYVDQVAGQLAGTGVVLAVCVWTAVALGCMCVHRSQM